MRSRVSRTGLIRSALESPDPCASNGGSSFGIKGLGADLLRFEMARFSIIRPTSFVTRSPPKCWIPKLEPLLNTQRSGLFSKLRISAVRHTYEGVGLILWNSPEYRWYGRNLQTEKFISLFSLLQNYHVTVSNSILLPKAESPKNFVLEELVLFLMKHFCRLWWDDLRAQWHFSRFCE